MQQKRNSVKNPHRKNPWAEHFENAHRIRKQAPSLELLRELKASREKLLQDLAMSDTQESLFEQTKNTQHELEF